ncbi:MAG TPA: glycogen debranching protein, partial [Ktedonobacter sp.]|nr:glycogen debranching protein [Ktedonobacter sp.]
MADRREDTEGYTRSLEILRLCLTPAGFVASPIDVDNYARVWARDGVITGLAALASGDGELMMGMKRTLTTLG